MDDTVKLSIEHIRKALDIIGDSAGQEAAIVAQFALDLAITAQFCPDGIDPSSERQLLRLLIPRQRPAPPFHGGGAPTTLASPPPPRGWVLPPSRPPKNAPPGV